MALVIPTGYGQASIEMLNDYDPEPWYVTHGVDLTDVGGDYEAAATTIGQAFETAWQNDLSNQVVITKVVLRVGQDGGPPFIYEVLRGNRGSSSAEMLPQNCALLVRKQTARAGRPGRGRVFLPGVLREAQVSQVGIIPSGEMTLLQNSAQMWLEDLTSSIEPGAVSVPMVLLHNAGVPGGTTPDLVTSLSVDNRISTQRRRLR